MKTSDIRHYPDVQMFVMKIDDEFAKIEYTQKHDTYYLIHSEVPKHLRGKGIGKELVEKTFEYLHEHEIKAIAVCSYIKAIVARSEKLQLLR